MSREYTFQDSVLLWNAVDGKWLFFKKPLHVITAATSDEVLPAFKKVESLVGLHQLHAAGFISYEASAAFDSAFHLRSKSDFPLLWFGLYGKPEEFQLPAPDLGAYTLGEFLPNASRQEYNHAIQKIKRYIHSGDTYQVNYTLRMRSAFSGDPWHLFLAMVRAQPSGYPAFINTERWAVCSASPELFFQLEEDRLICKPMKGTVQRGRTNTEDASLAHWLQQSEKNRAENLMIVDMIRNDLGRVAGIGSIQVPALFEVERHPTLWQMTSTVTANCGRPLSEILTALFPCASITGAPKIRTMDIISELEPDPRNLYTGSIGYIAPNRFAQFNVAIRTAIVDKLSGQAEYGAGGGIVNDSIAEDEYSEALLKSKVFTEQPREFSLLETILWTQEEGYFLLEYHLNRLADSAGYFDYPDKIESIRKQLLGLVPSYDGMPQKVRVLLSRDGNSEIQAAPISIPEEIQSIKIKLSLKPVDSADVFLFHKTTNRKAYEEARSSCADCDDVLLWNEHHELTESSIANLVVELDGKLITPPLESGVLPGTFRQWLLEKGEVREQKIRIDELNRCTQIFLVNSVRKWQKAVLI
jgi:para-aminobenzoate synthetase / 4-amino-4-deoxychorismate lyase